jgi:glycosyltransferase involved in cell wall biosynthesis
MAGGGRKVVRRVLLVLQSIAVGGMEDQCERLAAEFTRLGIEVAIVVPRGSPFDGLAARLGSAGAIVERIDSDARRGRSAQARAMVNLIGIMRRWRPDVVHLHTGGPTGGVAILLAARMTSRATVVVTEHNVPFAEPGRRLRLATRVKDGLAHIIIALSARNAALRRAWLGEPASFVGIPPGIGIAEMEPSVREAHRSRVRSSLGIPTAAIVITCVARLAEDKGLDDLVRAFAIVIGQQACELMLLGDGPLHVSLQTLAADLGVAQHTHFVGYRFDPIPYLDASDIFALAAPLGSGSIALLQAMSRRLPAVITFCGPGEFLVSEETGLCAPPRDPSGLANALLRLARDSHLRDTLGQRAGARVDERFRIERVARDHLEIYEAATRDAIPRRLRASALEDH